MTQQTSMEKTFNLAVLGAAGGIGQPLSLLLKQSPYIKNLSLFDVVPQVEGVAADISHINTQSNVVGICGDMKDAAKQKAQLHKALKDCDVVVIPAGIAMKPLDGEATAEKLGDFRDYLFKINAGIVKALVEAVAEVCPNAMLCIISNPVNSLVPVAVEVLKQKGVFDANKVFGVNTLDVVRANTFVGEKLGKDPTDLGITVVGGHSGVTILPILSEFKESLDQETVEGLTRRIRDAGLEVVAAKQEKGSATLSMAFAAAKFAESVMKAMAGEMGITECAFVKTDVVPGVEYFATSILLGENGALKVEAPKNLSEYERKLLETEVIPELTKNISKGLEFMSGSTSS